MRDEPGTLYQDEQFVKLFSSEGQPALAPWRLALITVLQFVEGLSDRQAAEMGRSRIDWKYLLSLELTDSGFHYSVLSEFRGRLLEGQAEYLLLDQLLTQVRERKLIKAKGLQRTDSTHVLAAVRLLNRLEMLGETLRAALNSLAVAAPEWLVEQIPAEWFDLYGRRIVEYRLPEKESERTEWALDCGVAGYSLWQVLGQNEELNWLRRLPALETLRQVWLQQFWLEDDQVRLRSEDNEPPPGMRIHSPYDVEARYATKRDLHWLGYKVHLTESCDGDSPNLITQVHTTAATVPDVKATTPIQQNLVARELAPNQHIVDGGYISADQVIKSQLEQGIELCGPLRVDASWQGQTSKGYAVNCFKLDWEAQKAVCPQGKVSQKWQVKTDNKGQEYVYIAFAKQDCQHCAVREACTRQVKIGRIIRLRTKVEHQVLEQTRQNSSRSLLNLRAGIEGTLSQGVRVFELRRCRYLGLAKTHLQHLITAVAINLVRLYYWWEELPRAKSRVSRFRTLKPIASGLC